jgi:hypothetical protein
MALAPRTTATNGHSSLSPPAGMGRACVKTQNYPDLQRNWGYQNHSHDDDRRLYVLSGRFFDRRFSSAFLDILGTLFVFTSDCSLAI